MQRIEIIMLLLYIDNEVKNEGRTHRIDLRYLSQLFNTVSKAFYKQCSLLEHTFTLKLIFLYDMYLCLLWFALINWFIDVKHNITT